MQPMYAMAKDRDALITENGFWLYSPFIIVESGIVMEMSTRIILYEKNM